MASTLAKSEAELARIERLLGKSVPSYRQAYSDRSAWIMACLSELAYIRFNPLFSSGSQKDYFIQRIADLVDDSKKSSLFKLIDLVGYDHEAEKRRLIEELHLLGMELIDEPFDRNGTQAILVEHEKFLALAFRGTEKNSIKDIKADAKAHTTQCDTGGKVHAGFDEAYKQVALDIQNKLNEERFSDKPLFITGHSLGGALATIAAKSLTHKGGIAACYTFGSPRVGDEDWIEFKAPIYRLVNAADCVTMLPPGAETITVISWLVQFIPSVGKPMRRWLLAKFGGYLHCGNMRFLTNCSSGRYQDVKLLYSVNIIYRLKGLIIKKLPWRKFLADHSISIYRKKLAMIAENKNL